MRKLVLIFTFSLLSLLSYGQNMGEEECETRLRRYVETLSADSLRGRFAGSEGENEAAFQMYGFLKDAGVLMISPEEGQDFYIANESDTIHSRNVVGIVEGYDEELKNQYVVLAANLDHLGSNIVMTDGKPVEQIFPGANNNASGLAVMAEVARRIAGVPYLFRRSVVFAAFGAREIGMAGAWYFVNRAFPEADKISLMVNLSSIGRMDYESSFVYFMGSPSPEIYKVMNDLSSSSVYLMPEPGTGNIPPSDYMPFYDKGIPFVLFTTGNNKDDRTVRDVPAELDYQSMDIICDFIFNFVREIANKDYMMDRLHGEKKNAGENNEERVYSPYEVDKAPTFLKGDERLFLQNWVYTYLKYPEIPLSQGISGTVIVEFVIEKDGTVNEVKAVRGDDPDLEAEAVRVISASPKWKPGVLGGEKVRVKYSLPVEFRLRKKR